VRKECEVRIEIPIKSEEQREKIFEAEKLLREAGIDFDTGYDLVENRRDWEFDWSLEGAKVYFKKFKESQKDKEK